MSSEKSENDNPYEISFGTNDVQSLLACLNILNGYDNDMNFFFTSNGAKVIHPTNDEGAFISVKIDRSKLLFYFYNSEKDEYFAGFNIKEFYNRLKGIQTKQSSNIYKLKDYDNFFVNAEGHASKDSANKLSTLDLDIKNEKPPKISNDERLFAKVTTVDFGSTCGALSRNGCKIVKFTKKYSALYVRGFTQGEQISTFTFRDGVDMGDDPDNYDVDEDSESQKKTYKKKGGITIVVNKAKTAELSSVYVPIEKLKPLTKSNNMCKNGIVHIYIGREQKVCKETNKIESYDYLYLKINVGQIGEFELYIKACDHDVHTSEYHRKSLQE